MKRAANLVMLDIEKVRHYVMGVIYHSEGRQVKLPSLRELAAEFGLAVSTVKIAFDRMEKEGYITSRHGVGSFTNPRKFFFPCQRALPLIGVKMGRGDDFYFSVHALKDLAEFTAQCALFPCNVRLLTAGCTTEEEFEIELRNSHIDALLTWQVDPKLVAAGAQLLPTVNIGYECKAVPSVVFREDAAARALADELCRDFEKPAILQLDDHPTVHGFGEALRRDARLRHTRKCGEKNPAPEYLEKQLAFGKYDCVISSELNAERIRELLDRGGRPDARLVLLGDGHYSDTPSCCYLAPPRHEEIATALAWLRKLLRGESVGTPEHIIEFQLLRHQKQESPLN